MDCCYKKKLKFLGILLFFVAVFVFFFSILFLRKESFQRKKFSVHLVVARYNEKIDWVFKEPYKKYPIFIYEKGPYPSSVPCHKRLFLKNVGRCDHTYLYHIIENYDSLPDVIIFLPANFSPDRKQEKVNLFMEKVAISEKAVEELFQKDPNFDHKPAIYNLQMDIYECWDENNRRLNPETVLHKASIRPFGLWFEDRFSKDTKINEIWYGGVLIATKERIRRRPVSFYKKLIVELETSSNPEVGHYIERSWFTIFNAPKKN